MALQGSSPQCKLEIIIFLDSFTFVRVHGVQVALVPLWQMYSAEQLLSGMFAQQLRNCMCDIDGKHQPIVLKIQRVCAPALHSGAVIFFQDIK